MGAHLATFVYAVGILGLFALDRDRKSKTSIALWIPVVWVSLAASRMVAQWLDATGLSELTLSIDPSAQLLEGNPLDRFLPRVGFLLVPISILLIKYYPAMGRVYNRHFGLSYNVGVATDKNELGIICLLFGVGSVWRIFLALQNSEESHRTRSLIAHGA